METTSEARDFPPHGQVRPRVALGMSGGVDSAVAAACLLSAGYDVLGVTCVFQGEYTAESCSDETPAAPPLNNTPAEANTPAPADAAAAAKEATHEAAAADRAIADAAAVCARLGIPHYTVDARDTFRRNVSEPFVRTYASGRTPCPCIECNATTKLPPLLAFADANECLYVATGHYARVVQLRENGRFAVKTALDARKDQSYMLALLSQAQLARLLLPLGGLTKAEVRCLAEDLGLPVAAKEESQDLCFCPGDYRLYLQEHGVHAESGPICTSSGMRVGTHTGLPFYTLGQRKGLGVAATEPYYVLEKRAESNTLIVGFAAEAQTCGVSMGGIVWQASGSFEEAFRQLSCGSTETPAGIPVRVKLRYRGQSLFGTLERQNPSAANPAASPANERLLVRLSNPSSLTAPGQYAVAYAGDAVLCAGVIEEVYRPC